MKYKEYREIIDNGFFEERELDEFINTIAEDETITDRQYEILRHLAIEEYYR